MKILKKIFCFLLFFSLMQLSAQNNVTPNSVFKKYKIQKGLPTKNIKDIKQDNIGYLWFATDKGVINFDGNEFTSFTKKNGLESNNTNTLLIKNDSLLIGTDKGLSIKNRNHFLNFESKKVNTIVAVKNEVYVGTSQGICKLKEDFLAPIRTNSQIDTSVINDIQYDGNHFWIATNKALWRVENLNDETSIKHIEKGNFTSILFNNKQIVVSTYNNGIQLIQGSKTINISSSPRQIKTFKKIKSEIWIATENEGIEVLNDDYSFSRKINKYNTLTTNHINTVFEDNQQNIWIATSNKGSYKFENNTNKKQENTKIAFENIEVVYQPIDSISLNNYEKTLKLTPNKNHLSFTFKTVNINQPKSIEYRYKLHDVYSPWSKNNNINLANLKAGNYTFIAQSRVDQKHQSKPIKFSFFIDKPIYQKAWFQSLSILIVSLILGGIIYSYVKRIKAKNKAKIEKLQLENHLLSLEQKALQLQMNPHFIFNVLNGIKALGNSNKSTELNTTINKFATLLRAILNNSRLEEISLAEEISTLKNYIELEQQMSSKPFEYAIETNLNLDTEEVLVPPMLIQPFVENSIKHGIQSIVENGKLLIDFTAKNDFLHCTIQDNGIGVHQSKKVKNTRNHNSLAVQVTKERIENLSGKNAFNIDEIKENNNTKGTKVWFKIPLKTDF